MHWSELVGGDIAPFAEVQATCATNTELPSLDKATGLFGRYFVEIERVIEHVNQMAD